MKKITISICTVIMMLSMAFSTSVFAANNETQTSPWDSFLGLFQAQATSAVGVEYQGHIQNVGNFPLDGSWIQGPTELGTEGKSLRLEGFWIQLNGTIPAGANIKYDVHVQNKGWLYDLNDTSTWAKNGDFAGTKGESLQIEAIQIVLVDNAGVPLKDYSVVYNGHIQNIGNVGPFKNGERLGTVGQFLRLEAIKVQIVQNPADLTAYNTALAAVKEADYTAASWTTYKAVLAANVVTTDSLISAVKTATDKIVAAQAQLQKLADLTAYNTALAAVKEADYTAASWTTYKAVLAANVVTTADLQSAVDTATAKIVAAQANLVLIPKVTSVTATYPKTITVVGSALAALTAADINVEGNEVVSFVANAAGTEATITLGSNLAPGVDTDVKITIEGKTTTYVVNFVLDVQAITVVEKTFDDDRANQKVTFKVDGQLADVDYLALAGYNVNYVATDKDGAPADIFEVDEAASNTSTDGVLYDKLTDLIGKYNVEVQLIKAGSVMVSDTGIIEIANLDAKVTSIDAVEFGLGTGSPYDGYYVPGEFALNSTKLVAGEEAIVHVIDATVGGESIVVPAEGFTVKSSNAAVISVNPDTYALTANAKGTAVITVIVGDQEKAYTFTVTNSERDLAKITAAPTTSKGVVGFATDVKFTTVDQYGDPYAVDSDKIIDEVIPKNADGDLLVKAFDVVTPDSGIATIALTPTAPGTGTVYFKDHDANVIGTLGLNITENSSIASKKLVIVDVDGQSDDNNLELSEGTGKMITYKLGLYNPSGVYVGAGDFRADYTVESADDNIATVEVDPDGSSFTITGEKVGATDIVVKNAAGVFVAKTRVTVTNNPYKISAVDFKTVGTIDFARKTIFAKDVLSLTASELDDVVNGVTLTKSSESQVRIAEKEGTSASGILIDDLYLDLDNNGLATDGDVFLGTVSAVAASDATFSVNPYTTGYVENGIVTTASGDKGTVIVKIMRNAGDPKTAIASTSFYVNVK